ncbi:hypothetical protein [Streptomyces nigrescens]|uniref:hypothetical protein n=1 Tax=Streptomyces nigrescens TaxID=1920 RepID=UPI0036FFD6F5
MTRLGSRPRPRGWGPAITRRRFRTWWPLTLAPPPQRGSGREIWRKYGIGGPDDTERLKDRITTLDRSRALDLKLQDRDQDLADGAASCELIAQFHRDLARREE